MLGTGLGFDDALGRLLGAPLGTELGKALGSNDTDGELLGEGVASLHHGPWVGCGVFTPSGQPLSRNILVVSTLPVFSAQMPNGWLKLVAL